MRHLACFVARSRAVLALSVLLSLTACATKPPASDADALAAYEERNDKIEPLNRAMFGIDQALDALIGSDRYERVDIDSSDELVVSYGFRVPVLAVDGVDRLEAPITEPDLREVLAGLER